jgi:GntR family transcriptional regulator
MREKGTIPLFQRIRIQLYRDISNGVFRVGDFIPTEADLMKRYNTSRTTVRRAIAGLVEEGIIVGKRGKGSIVKRNVAKANVRLRGSFGDILDVAKNTLVKVLRLEYLAPDPEISKHLAIKGDRRVLRVDRVRFTNKTPFLYSINYLPEDIGQFLCKKDFEEAPLLELLSKKCHVELKSAVQDFSAAVADHYVSHILNVPVGFPLLEIKRVVLSSEGTPVNLFVGFFRADIYSCTTTFSYEEQK